MDFRDYTYVQAIAKYKTISKAADALYISQPSLSKFLQSLEKSIGTPLFQRVNKQMYPTYAGTQFLKTGEEIFLLQKQLNNRLKQICHQESGQLRIAATSTRGYYIFPDTLPLFKRQHPEYHVEIMERNVDEVEQALRNGASDLALYACTSRHPDFRYFHIATEEVTLVLVGNHPLAEKAIPKKEFRYPWINLAQLHDEVMFVNDSSQWLIGRIARQLIREAGISPEITEFRSLDTCLALASRGLGFTISPDICRKCFKNYEIPPIYLSTGQKPFHTEFVIACRKNYQLKRAERDFIDLLRQQFGETAEFSLP